MYKAVILPKFDEQIEGVSSYDSNINNSNTNMNQNRVISNSNNINACSNTINIASNDAIKEEEIKTIVSDLPKELPKETQKEEDKAKIKPIEETLACKIIETTDFSNKERIIVQLSE